MKLPGVVAPPDLGFPGTRAFRLRVPSISVRAVFAVVGSVLSLVDYGASGWLVVGILLSVAAACSPQYLLGWVVVLFLAAGRLAHHASLSWQFLVMLLGLHLLHVLAMLALELPWRSWVQARVFVAPLRRLVVVQVPVQLIAVVALLLLAPGTHGHRPLTIAGFGVVGALALACLALLLTGPRVDERRPPRRAGS